MADYAGIFAMLATGVLVLAALFMLERRLAARSRRQGAQARAGRAAAARETSERDDRSGSRTRLRVGFLFGALVFLVVEVALVALVPWALAARGLGGGAWLGFAALLLPGVIGLLHAASRGALEW